MAGKMKATTVLAAVLVVVAMMTTSSVMTVEARLDLDLSSILGYKGIKEAPCCDLCICARTYPPICKCTDIKPSCHSKCKHCICAPSIPPQCQCLDFSRDVVCDPCSPSSSSSNAAAAFINDIAN